MNVLKNTILQGTPPANIASFVATSYSIEIAQSTSVLPIVTGLSSTPRYVDINGRETYRPIPDILEELNTLKKKAEMVDSDLQKIFKGLQFS